MSVLFYWKSRIFLSDQRDPHPINAFHQNGRSMLGLGKGDRIWAFTRNSEENYVLAAQLPIISVEELAEHERSPYGKYRAKFDVTRAVFYAVSGAPDAERLIRGLSIAPKADSLGQSFQGLGGVKTITPDDEAELEQFATQLTVESSYSSRIRPLP